MSDDPSDPAAPRAEPAPADAADLDLEVESPAVAEHDGDEYAATAHDLDEPSPLDERPAGDSGPSTSTAWGSYEPMRLSPLTRVLAALVVVALFAVLVLAALHVAGVGSGASRADERRADAVAAARQAVVNVTSFDYRKLDAQLKEVEATSGGAFAKELAATKAALLAEVKAQERVSSSRVVETAVGATSEKEIVVLLAVDETRKTKAEPKGVTLRYRMQVRMDRKGNRWILVELRPVS